MTSSLAIHVFGDGNGEAIFIEFPNQKVGIIDFGHKGFLDWFATYKSEKGLKEIEFLLWTHPHDDHTHYLFDLLDYCEQNSLIINYFTRFHFGKLKSLIEIIDNINDKIINNSTDIYVNSMKPKYLLELFDKLKKLQSAKIIKNADAKLCLGHILYGKGAISNEISIECIAPCEKDIDDYNRKHNECLNKWSRGDSQNDFAIASSLHNLISVAVIIHYNDLRILLGGDVENPSWMKIYSDNRYEKLLKSNIVFLKAPHHGSEGAYNQNIWNNWGKDYQIIVAPYNKSCIPKTETLEKIMLHSKNIKVLKDKSKRSVFGDSEFLINKIANKKEQITICSDAIYHIAYTISSDGAIDYHWIQ